MPDRDAKPRVGLEDAIVSGTTNSLIDYGAYLIRGIISTDGRDDYRKLNQSSYTLFDKESDASLPERILHDGLGIIARGVSDGLLTYYGSRKFDKLSHNEMLNEFAYNFTRNTTINLADKFSNNLADFISQQRYRGLDIENIKMFSADVIDTTFKSIQDNLHKAVYDTLATQDLFQIFSDKDTNRIALGIMQQVLPSFEENFTNAILKCSNEYNLGDLFNKNLLSDISKEFNNIEISIDKLNMQLGISKSNGLYGSIGADIFANNNGRFSINVSTDAIADTYQDAKHGKGATSNYGNIFNQIVEGKTD